MKLSFVIPAYNEEKHIASCLASVLRESKRSGRDIEVIAVNNASTDRTRDIIASFPEVKLVDEPTKGLPQARQAGFLASTGDLIANVDADSIIPQDWIEKVFYYFSRNDKLVALSGPYVYYDFSKTKNFLVRAFYYPGYIANKINHYLFGRAAMLQGGNFVLKRPALEKIGGFNTDIKFYGEDTDIAWRIKDQGEVKFTYKLPMHTSARRLKKEGLVKMGAKYAANYFWTIIFKKPLSKNFKDIRE
jgi:cellulose synthase/poly-beta-1,6-N-acetylglucosamine synthase-like glycosyltransferase